MQTSVKYKCLLVPLFPLLQYPQARDLFNLGQCVAMSIVQGCGGFPFLSEGVYKYFTTGEGLGIAVNNGDVLDSILRFVLNKVTPCA